MIKPTVNAKANSLAPTEEQICERMPIWEALSEFFLDDELSSEDHQRIASVLARSRYTDEESQAILRHEVYPACSLNLTCVAGAWGTWGEDWIRERIAPRYDRRPRFYLPAFNWNGISKHWNVVRKMVSKIRSNQQDGGGNC